MRTQVKQHVIGALAALAVAPSAAVAEEWVLYRSSGDEPARRVFLIDRIPIAQTSSEPIAVTMAILSESGLQWPPQVITEMVISCTEGRGEISRAELRDEHGGLLRVIEDNPFGRALTDSDSGKEILGIVCEDHWPDATASFEDHSLSQIYEEAFGPTEDQTSGELIPALEQLAAQNNAEAVYHLGMAFQTGAGLPENPAKALELFRRAAALGDALASYKLGCFYDGQGGTLVEDDTELALRHKLVAAEAGYALAQQDVATLYAAQGDLAAAVDWLEKAALQGWPDALATYASIHNGAEGITPDAVKTAAYFRLFLDRTDGSDRQRVWLEEFEERMTPEQRQQAKDVVRDYRAAPTPLTIKALSGQRAAAELISKHEAGSFDSG